MTNLIHIDSVNNVDVVDSRLIAEELDIQHKSFIKTVKKYLTQIEAFGVLRFEIAKPPQGSNGGRPELYCYLNEDQATFVMSLSKNTDKVVNCKMKLVKSFSQAKQVITQQVDRIRELELELQLAQAKTQQAIAEKAVTDTRHLITQTCPEPVQQRIFGYTEIKTIEYRDRIIKDKEVIRDGTTLNKTELCHRYGFLTKSGNPNYKQLNAKLTELNIPSEAWELKVALRENQEFKSEYLDKLDDALINDDRQLFLGE